MHAVSGITQSAGNIAKSRSASFATTMPPSAHIAGIPVEETLSMFGPAAAVILGAWVLTVKTKLAQLLRRARPARRVKAPHAG